MIADTRRALLSLAELQCSSELYFRAVRESTFINFHWILTLNLSACIGVHRRLQTGVEPAGIENARRIERAFQVALYRH
jgi:hypothetical protein